MSQLKNRFVFEYRLPDGSKRFADPSRVVRRLTNLLQGQVAEVAAAFASKDDAAAQQAYSLLSYAVCTAFDLGLPFDAERGEGVRDDVWVKTWNDFQNALDAEAKALAASGPDDSQNADESGAEVFFQPSDDVL